MLYRPEFSCADPAQPFDFLILGELLRQPLEKLLLAHTVSTVHCQGYLEHAT